MKKDPFYFLIISVLFVAFLLPSSAVGATEGEVEGWAWMGADCAEPDNGDSCSATTEPLGWISFNSSNEDAGGNYGVYVDYEASAENALQGEAWIGGGNQDGVGWLDFESNDTPSCGTNGYPSGNCNAAYVDTDDYTIKGWAPIRSKDANRNSTTVSWVRFEGDNYSSKIMPDGKMGDGDTNHYAWAGGADNSDNGRTKGTVFGWIDLNPSGIAEEEKLKFPKTNQKPEVSFDSNGFNEVVNEVYCDKRVELNWQYNDPDEDKAEKWELEIYDSNNNLVVTKTKSYLSLESGSDISQLFWIGDNYDLKFGNKNYTWRVKVYDEHDETSGWVSSPDDIYTPHHAYPEPSFDPQPKSPEVDTQVTFEDSSYCYDEPNADGDYCVNYDNNKVSYSWDFGDGETSNVIGSATHTYTTDEKREVELWVTDEDLNAACHDSERFDVILPLPEWEEVSSQ